MTIDGTGPTSRPPAPCRPTAGTAPPCPWSRSAASPPASTASSCVATTPAATGASSASSCCGCPRPARSPATAPSTPARPTATTAWRSPRPVTTAPPAAPSTRRSTSSTRSGPPAAATALTVNRAASIVSLDGTIPAAGRPEPLPEGVHHVLVRSHDDLDLWGPELDIPLVIDRTGPTVTAAAVMPNPSNGELDDPGNPGNVVVSAQIEDVPTVATGTIVEAEGFLDPGADPAPGTGFDMLAVDGALDSLDRGGLRPDPGLGDPRPRRTATTSSGCEVWTPPATGVTCSPTPLTVDKTAPVLGAVTRHAEPDRRGRPPSSSRAPSTRPASAVPRCSWATTDDPGPGNATPIQLSLAGGQATVDVPVPPFTAGFVPFNLRVQDLAGNWSNTPPSSSASRGAPGPGGLPSGSPPRRPGERSRRRGRHRQGRRQDRGRGLAAGRLPATPRRTSRRAAGPVSAATARPSRWHRTTSAFPAVVR